MTSCLSFVILAAIVGEVLAMIQLPEEFTVAEAATEEILKILLEPQLFKHLPVSLPSGMSKYVRTHKHIFYLARFNQHKLLFFFFEHPRMNDVYEIHIACPKASIRASRVLATLAAKWIAKTGTIGAKALITKCPIGKISNMCRKLGGKVIYQHKSGDVSILFDTSVLYY